MLSKEIFWRRAKNKREEVVARIDTNTKETRRHASQEKAQHLILVHTTLMEGHIVGI